MLRFRQTNSRVWYGMVWYGMVWCGCGCGVVWLWCGVVWCGMASDGMAGQERGWIAVIERGVMGSIWQTAGSLPASRMGFGECAADSQNKHNVQ